MSNSVDHRQLAEDMALYCMNDNIGAGLPLWLPNGCAIRDKLEQFIKNLERKAGYRRVSSPHIAKAKLYELSGHLKHYREDMFPEMVPPSEVAPAGPLPLAAALKQNASASYEFRANAADASQSYFLRPMNCPHHHMIFAGQPRSYRELPLRLAEYGQVYRFEKSGSLKGLSRVRGLCQNDGHIYVARASAGHEISQVLKLHEEVYRLLGLKGYRYRLSLRDPHRPKDFEGDSKKWNEAENVLRQALIEHGLDFVEEKGEAAFYGPKIDIQMQMGSKEESISSIQLDFLSGESFGLRFAAQDGSMEIPWIIHRAPLGSHERFIALLLEYFEGRLPAWLAPVAVAIVPVNEKDLPACRELEARMLEADIGVHVEFSQGSLAKRIEKAHRLRPVCKIVVGARDLAREVWQLEFRDRKIQCAANEVIQKLKAEVAPPS